MAAAFRSSRRARRRVWVVTEPSTLAMLLATLGEPPDVAEEGRVLVDGRRERSADRRLAVGARVELRAARVERDVVVLDRRPGLIAVDKPAEIATEPDRSGARGSLVERVARELGLAAGSVHAASRLDVGVSGVVLLATEARSRRHLAALRAAGRIERSYRGIVAQPPIPDAGVWSWPVSTPRGAQPASTNYRVLEVAPSGHALIELVPVTGRRHQLRLHAARAGAPLLGDRAHGGEGRVAAVDGAVIAIERIALHAGSVRLLDADDAPWTVEAPWPAALAALWHRVAARHA